MCSSYCNVFPPVLVEGKYVLLLTCQLDSPNFNMSTATPENIKPSCDSRVSLVVPTEMLYVSVKCARESLKKKHFLIYLPTHSGTLP